MVIDNNAIIGYGIVIHINTDKIVDADSDDLYFLIEDICNQNNIDFIHDCYWTDFDIFIGKVIHQVQNGNKTILYKKDVLTSNSTLEFKINEDVKNKITNTCESLKKYIKITEPSWNLFTYNS